MKKNLVPFNFSNCSDNALKSAVALSRKTALKIIVVIAINYGNAMAIPSVRLIESVIVEFEKIDSKTSARFPDCKDFL